MSELVTDVEWPVIEGDRIGAGPETPKLVADLAAQSWLVKSPFGYVLTRHADCVAVLKDKRWFQASRLLAELNQITDERCLKRQERPSILSMEGEEHQRVRRLVSGAFTPRSADRLRPFMREVLNGLLDPIAESGRCDFVADVCDPYPLSLIHI